MTASALLLAPAVILTGCHREMRETVVATTQSMIGLSLAQNVQSQMYELRIGYARNEFFWVPTSKRVYYDENGGERTWGSGQPAHDDPIWTPEVLAEIQVGGRGKLGIGSDQGARVAMYQRLAMGKRAVESKAAVALMANDPETARALVNIPTVLSTPNAVEMQTEIRRLVRDKGLYDRARNWIATYYPDHPSLQESDPVDRFIDHPPGEEPTLRMLLDLLKQP